MRSPEGISVVYPVTFGGCGRVTGKRYLTVLRKVCRPPARKPLSRSTCFDFLDDLRNNATCFARRMAGPIESSTNARVMDRLDRSSRWQRKVLPQKWVMARRFK